MMRIIKTLIFMGISEIVLMCFAKAIVLMGMPLAAYAPFILCIGTLSIAAGAIVDIAKAVATL